VSPSRRFREIVYYVNKDERLLQLATSVMGSYGLEIAKDIDRWVEKESGPIRREVLGQMRLSV